MKTIKLFLIIAITLLLTNSILAQRLRYEDMGECYRVTYISEIVDSAETFTSAEFPAYSIINLLQQTFADTGTTAIATATLYEFIKKPYVIVKVKGTGAVDSLSYLYLQGKFLDDVWATVDSLNTAKEVACVTYILGSHVYNVLPMYSSLRFTGEVADLTVSAYGVTVWIEVIIPKLFK